MCPSGKRPISIAPPPPDLDRNQHLVRTTFPTSAGYESERYPTMGVLRQEPEDDNTAVNGPKAEVGQEVLGNLNRSWSFERQVCQIWQVGNIADSHQYEWTGTIDWTPFLSVTAALEFRRSIGGEQRIMKYCHSLAVQCVSVSVFASRTRTRPETS